MQCTDLMTSDIQLSENIFEFKRKLSKIDITGLQYSYIGYDFIIGGVNDVIICICVV